MTWKTTLSFIVGATLLILLSGWLLEANLLPIQSNSSYSEVKRNFVQLWFRIAIVLGIILPVAAFLVGIRRPKVRIILGFYLLVLAVQIVTERILIQIFPSSLMVIIGISYTTFRIWQLRQGQQLAATQSVNAYSQFISGLLLLLLLFWSANFVVLLILIWEILIL